MQQPAQKILTAVARSQRLAVLNLLKRRGGLAVAEIAPLLDLSYMGAKRCCLILHREGLLETWRSPVPVGRPRLVYRLTRRAEELFGSGEAALVEGLLDAARKLFGAMAPGKMWFLYFQEKTASYASRLKGDTPAERARWLARLRDADGYMSSCETDEGVPRIIERHTPLLDLVEKFPEIGEMERAMFEKLLGARVRREVETLGGHYLCRFSVG